MGNSPCGQTPSTSWKFLHSNALAADPNPHPFDYSLDNVGDKLKEIALQEQVQYHLAILMTMHQCGRQLIPVEQQKRIAYSLLEATRELSRILSPFDHSYTLEDEIAIKGLEMIGKKEELLALKRTPEDGDSMLLNLNYGLIQSQLVLKLCDMVNDKVEKFVHEDTIEELYIKLAERVREAWEKRTIIDPSTIPALCKHSLSPGNQVKVNLKFIGLLREAWESIPLDLRSAQHLRAEAVTRAAASDEVAKKWIDGFG